MVGGQLIGKGNSYLNPGGELIKRSLCQAEESITGGE